MRKSYFMSQEAISKRKKYITYDPQSNPLQKYGPTKIK